MNLKKLNIALCLCLIGLGFSSIFNASETVEDRYVPSTSLSKSISKAVSDTNFNGTVMVSKNNGDSYDILYQDAIGSDGGYDIDTVYDIGSVSKLYTTTAIMLLEQEGKLEYDDKISKFIDDVPSDKADITIEMLLTHSSGLYVPENEDHDVSKNAEISRILKSNLNFEPGTNYVYSNAGFTLLAAIIESASEQSYEDFITDNIIVPLDLKKTGFPNSNYLKDEPAVAGTLNGESYGKVTDFDFGWFSKGYTDVLTTPRELTYFFNALVSGRLLDDDNLKLMNSTTIQISDTSYRGYGTEHFNVGTETEVVGHSGVWYGGNTAAYYRPSDGLVFIMMCDELTTSGNLPANHAFNSLNAMYPTGALKDQESVETVAVGPLYDPNAQEAPEFDVEVSEIENSELIEPLSRKATVTNLDTSLEDLSTYIKTNRDILLIYVCLVAITVIIVILILRIYG